MEKYKIQNQSHNQAKALHKNNAKRAYKNILSVAQPGKESNQKSMKLYGIFIK
jgi:hypothetical protein